MFAAKGRGGTSVSTMYREGAGDGTPQMINVPHYLDGGPPFAGDFRLLVFYSLYGKVRGNNPTSTRWTKIFGNQLQGTGAGFHVFYHWFDPSTDPIGEVFLHDGPLTPTADIAWNTQSFYNVDRDKPFEDLDFTTTLDGSETGGVTVDGTASSTSIAGITNRTTRSLECLFLANGFYENGNPQTCTHAITGGFTQLGMALPIYRAADGGTPITDHGVVLSSWARYINDTVGPSGPRTRTISPITSYGSSCLRIQIRGKSAGVLPTIV